MIVEMLIASCMISELPIRKMTCSYHNSEWWNRSVIVSYSPGDYIGPTCVIKDDLGKFTLVAESCVDFKKRLK